MPLQKQMIDVPLSLGLDQKTDIRSLQPQGAVTMTNCVHLKNGAVRKRFGHTQQGAKLNSDTGTVYNAGALRGRIWATTGNQLYSWSDQTLAFESMGPIPEVACLDRIGVGASSQTIIDYDAVPCNNLLVSVFVVSTNTGSAVSLQYSVTDLTAATSVNAANPTAAVIIAMVDLTSSVGSNVTGPKLAACGTTVVCTFMVNNALKVMSFDATHPNNGWSIPSTLVTTAGAAVAGVYDLSPVAGDATRFAIAYESNTAGLSAFISICSVSGLTINSTQSWETQANFNTFKSIALTAKNNGHYWMMYIPTAGASIAAGVWQVRVGFFNENGSTIGTQATIFTTSSATIPVGKSSIAAVSLTQGIAVWGTGYAAGTAAMNSAYVRYSQVRDSSGTVVSTVGPNFTPNVQLASRAVFNPSGFTNIQPSYFAVSTPSAIQGTTYVVAADHVFSTSTGTTGALRPIATFAPRLLKQQPQPMVTSFTAPNLALVSGMLNGATYTLPTSYSVSTFHNAIAVQLVDFLPTYSRSTAVLGNELLMTGGAPAFWAGSTMTEAGYSNYPELATPTMAGAGGSLSAGVYQWIAIYVWWDLQGNVHRSATSPAVSATAVNSDKATVVIPLPSVTWRQNQSFTTGVTSVTYAFVILYRTTSNGTLFYQQTSDPPPFANLCDTSGGANTLTIVDTTSDATLTASATAQLLYTTGGVLDNFNPPTARVVFQHGQRYILSGCDEPTAVWPSKALTTGEMPGFNEAFNYNATGYVRAGASLDDKAIFFVQRSNGYGIEYVTGQGPTDTGTQSDWSPPLPIPSDSGAIDQRGTCVGPFGVLYRSPVGGPNGNGGIFLLSRDLQVTYVSKAVEDTLNANPIVTSMVVHPNNGRVYITCVPTEYGFTSGVRLVWDYLHDGVWSIDNLNDPDTSQTSAGSRCAFVSGTGTSGAAYNFFTAGGRMYRETNGVGANSYTDAGTFVQMTYQSAWLKPSLSGFARFWGMQLLGDSLDAHDFTMTLTYDFAPSSYYSESATFTAPSILNFDRYPQANVYMIPGNQKSSAIQVTLQDAAPTNAMSPVIATGTAPPTVTLTGTPVGAPFTIEIDIITPGGFLVGQFTWKLNGVPQATLFVTTTQSLGATGITAHFTNATYSTDNVYKSQVPVLTTGQGPSWAGLVIELAAYEGAQRNIPPVQRA